MASGLKKRGWKIAAIQNSIRVLKIKRSKIVIRELVSIFIYLFFKL